MNQALLIISLIFGVLLTFTLIALFFVSRKSQHVMESLLTIMTHPERVKIKEAARVLNTLLSDEVAKINTNFTSMAETLNNQIEHTKQLSQELATQNDKMEDTANETTKKISNMSQRLDNTIDGLQNIVNSNGWHEIQQAADTFSANIDGLLNKMLDITTNTTENSAKIQDSIVKCTEMEQQISEQLQKSLQTNTENMASMTESASGLQEQLNKLQTNVADDFTKIKTESADYDSVMQKNDKMLNDYLTKLSEFTKQSNKELVKQSNDLKETANVVAGSIRLTEVSLGQQIGKLQEANDSLRSTAALTQTSVNEIGKELTSLTNLYNGKVQEYSQAVLKELQEVSGIANTTLENTKGAATDFASSVKAMDTIINETLIKVHDAHAQLSGQSETLVKLSTETTEKIKPLSALIEKYYKALPDLASGSQEMNDNIENIVNTLIEKINLMKSTIAESLKNINASSNQLGNVAGESRQQMIDLMSDYTKAVEAMQSLNKQMMVARASAPMDAIKVTPAPTFKPISTKDFLNQADKLFTKLYEQSVDLTRTSGSEIPEIIWKKYNDGDTKIFAKWLAKVFAATNKKQIRELLKSDSVFRSQANQFARNFAKVLAGAEQTNDAEHVKSLLLKTDLGIIYNAISANL